MELLQLKYFQAVARQEHMTRAAKELAVAQPALSQTIARLESEAGVPLFDRQGRQIKLNPFGRAFLKHIDRALADIEDGLREVKDLAGMERGHISLGVMATQILGDLLKAFGAEHPQVKFRVHQHSLQTMVERLHSGELDLCIASMPIEYPGIRWQTLMYDEIILIVPYEHPLAGRSSVRLDELAGETFINLKSGNNLRDWTDAYFERAGIQPDIAYEIDEPASVRSLVKAGLGISFSTMLNLRFWDHTSVMPLRIAEPVCRRPIGLAWKEDRYHSMAARSFREFVQSFFARVQQEEIESADKWK
ncbi:LysR family transcriptional regulator [Paenibacillus doosanensis]|uniref:HTH-type transcriptional regulator GltC n=1 Tax=Paenibacillus konkukensis TaxID=2020716 RepID=A0ABY4RSJ8_9BACL|nr:MULTISPECIES: LysR family transcriptional regulator [Paenibacillus]MCS7462022.1 LysR family transcriptional regulator [Paenibacillus doosanensis]UQZ85083.1 HTH-type transcriptional regulator GltC [Paenibacillus konkukensis]